MILIIPSTGTIAQDVYKYNIDWFVQGLYIAGYRHSGLLIFYIP